MRRRKETFRFKPYKPVYKIKRIKIDSDRDGVPNWRDCRPFNPRLQHLPKRKKKALKKMNIFIGTPEGVGAVMGEKLPSGFGSGAKKSVKRYEQKLHSTFAKNPAAYESVERIHKRGYDISFHGGRGTLIEGTPGMVGVTRIGDKDEKLVEVKMTGAKRTKIGEETIIHEEVHTAQAEKDIASMAHKPYKSYKEYRSAPIEVEARKISKRKMRELKKEKEVDPEMWDIMD